MLRVYEIFIPELGVYVKFKVLPPEDITKFIEGAAAQGLTESQFTKHVIENMIFNIKTDIMDSIKMMSEVAGKAALEALYNGVVMLNPVMDIDKWISLCYADDKNLLIDFSDPDVRESLGFGEASFIFDQDTEETAPDTKRKRISKAKFVNLPNYLSSRVIGQSEAIEAIVNSLKRSQVGLNDSQRPLGVYLFAGSSGVGKTYLARELHSYLFGDDYDIVRIDCGEFQHKHDNQKLIGSPPGYVGHDEGGQLTNHMAEHSNTVVLLDEVEKAHPDLFNTFLRVFDEGMLTDSRGRQISFRNAIIIMTTNLGNDKTVDSLVGRSAGFNARIETAHATKMLPPRAMVERHAKDAIKKMFKPEFLNRIDQTIVFNHLTPEDYKTIANLEMQVIDEKLTKKGITFKYDDSVLDALIEVGVDTIYGARGMAQVRRDQIETMLADQLLGMKTTRGSVFELSHADGFHLIVRAPKKNTKTTEEAG